MMVTHMLKVIALAMVMTLCEAGQGQDATMKAGAFGMDVVNTVIGRIRSKCVFSEDRLFLRRTAYVMSHDGHDTDTYRPGFDGGIWKINQSMFTATKTCSLSSLQAACSNISSALGIDWSKVQWSDLRKPMYSGLAAALYTLKALKNTEMPGDIPSQAKLWAKMYGETDGSTFENDADLTLKFKCKDKLDLAFILDSSGSVHYSDYVLMKNFTASVVDVMEVSLSTTRIADIVYSSNVIVHFDFDDCANKATVKSRLLSAPKIDSGTDTAAGLDKARFLFQSSGSGARSDSKKVAVLVTDGRSSNFDRTKTAARSLKAADITVFAVGVGNYVLRELQEVASDPVCSHVLTLTGFDKIDSIITEIQKSTCEANYKLSATKPIGGPIPEEPVTTTTTSPVPRPDEMIEADVTCGVLHVFVSKTDPKPGPAVFDYLYTATDGAPAVLRGVETLNQGTSVYITVVGTRLPQSIAALRKCTDYKWSLGVVPQRKVNVVCKEKGVQRPCKDRDIIDAGFCSKNLALDYPVDNPCTKENLDKGIVRHSYPYDPTKFLQCDQQGHYYITICPGGVTYNAQTRECGFTSPGASPPETEEDNDDKGNGTQSRDPEPATSAGINSVCTPESLAKHQYYHPHPRDKFKFIQCDAWGTPYTMTCASGTQWSQSLYTCGHATSAGRRGALCVHDQLYERRCEPTKFDICDHGVLKEKSCPDFLIFNLTALRCTWPPPGGVTVPPFCLP